MTAAAITQLPSKERESLEESAVRQEDRSQARIEQMIQDLLSDKEVGLPCDHSY